MIRTGTNNIKDNAKIAFDVYNANGKELLKKGNYIKTFQIEKLKLYEVPYIYITDERVFVSSLFDMKTRSELLKIIQAFCDTDGENAQILKIYNNEEVNKFIAFKNDKADAIAYGHVMKFFVHELILQMKKNGAVYYDFTDGRTSADYFFFHMINVCCLSLTIGFNMGLKDEDLIDLGVGALLCDIKMKAYKFASQDKLFDKLEKEEMMQHTLLSYELIRRIYGVSAKSAAVSGQHHERFDGSGYPKGLKDEEISLFSRIVGLADVYDALCSNRPFRKAFTPEQAWHHIVEGSGTLFDPAIIAVFKKTIPVYYPGDIVEISNGAQALVVKNNFENLRSPVIKIIEKRDKSDIITGREINTAAEKCEIIKTTEYIR
ncbi:MAG: HD domain-containing phosphohydrolase [bacterium]